MPKHSKRFNNISKDLEHLKLYSVEDAFERVKKTATAKFDESVDVAVRTGLDPEVCRPTIARKLCTASRFGQNYKSCGFCSRSESRRS